MPLSWVKKRLYKRPDRSLIKDALQNAPLTHANITLLICLQLCLWGASVLTLLQEVQKTQIQVEKVKSKLTFQHRLSSGDYFPEQLKQQSWLSWRWVKSSCGNRLQQAMSQGNGNNSLLVFCLEIEGTAEAQEWRAALDQLDEFSAFYPVAMYWERFDAKKVQGKLRLQIIKNTANRLAQSFYPFTFYSDVPFSKEILLVGSVFTQQKWRSLLVVDNHALSVGEGDWLPELMASVVSIDKNKIELRYVNGKTVPVFLRNQLKGEGL